MRSRNVLIPVALTPPDGYAFIYALSDPRTDVIRYIGRTCRSFQLRYSMHFSNYCGNAPKRAWISELKSAGLMPQMHILEIAPLAQQDEREKHWIKLFLDRVYNAPQPRTAPERAKHRPYNVRRRLGLP